MQIAKIPVTVLAGALNQVVPHGLVRTPTLIKIIELEDAEGEKKALRAQCFTNVGALMGTIVLTDARLVVAAAYTVNGILYAAAPADPFWDLTGFNVTNAMFNLCLLCIDNLGAMQIGIGTEAALLANVVLPDTPADSCVVAMLEINPTGAGNFVGGTTDLNDGGVVPNAVFTNRSGHPDLYGEITLGTAADARKSRSARKPRSARKRRSRRRDFPHFPLSKRANLEESRTISRKGDQIGYQDHEK